MLKEYEDVLNFLTKNGFVGSKQIVDETLSIENVSVRNCNLKIVSGSGVHYFLKHDMATTGDEKGDKGPGSIAYEFEIYKLFEIIFKDTDVYHCLPRCYAFDPVERVLVLDAIPNSVNLGEHYFIKNLFPRAISENMGKTLAEVHKQSAGKKKLLKILLVILIIRLGFFLLPNPTTLFI